MNTNATTMNAGPPAVTGTAPDSAEAELELPSGVEDELGDAADQVDLLDYNDEDDPQDQLPTGQEVRPQTTEGNTRPEQTQAQIPTQQTEAPAIPPQEALLSTSRASLLKILPALSAFQLKLTEEDKLAAVEQCEDQVRLHTADRTAVTAKDALAALRQKHPSVDEFCFELNESLIGINPEFLATLVASREILLGLIQKSAPLEEGETLETRPTQEVETRLIQLGLQAMIELKVNPDEDLRTKLGSQYSELMQDRGMSETDLYYGRTCEDFSKRSENTRKDVNLILSPDFLLSPDGVEEIVAESLLSEPARGRRTKVASVKKALGGLTVEFRKVIAHRLDKAKAAFDQVVRSNAGTYSRLITTANGVFHQERTSRGLMAHLCHVQLENSTMSQRLSQMAKALLASQETQAMSSQVLDRYRQELERLQVQYALQPVRVQQLYESKDDKETKKLLDNDMFVGFSESGSPHFTKRDGKERLEMRARLNPSGCLDELVAAGMDDYLMSLPIPEQDRRPLETFTNLDYEMYQSSLQLAWEELPLQREKRKHGLAISSNWDSPNLAEQLFLKAQAQVRLSQGKIPKKFVRTKRDRSPLSPRSDSQSQQKKKRDSKGDSVHDSGSDRDENNDDIDEDQQTGNDGAEDQQTGGTQDDQKKDQPSGTKDRHESGGTDREDDRTEKTHDEDDYYSQQHAEEQDEIYHRAAKGGSTTNVDANDHGIKVLEQWTDNGLVPRHIFDPRGTREMPVGYAACFFAQEAKDPTSSKGFSLMMEVRE